MDDVFNQQTEVASPCNKICKLDVSGICIGCGRSREEITLWSQASQRQRRRIVDTASSRLATQVRQSQKSAE